MYGLEHGLSPFFVCALCMGSRVRAKKAAIPSRAGRSAGSNAHGVPNKSETLGESVFETVAERVGETAVDPVETAVGFEMSVEKRLAGRSTGAGAAHRARNRSRRLLL